jgi:hypothetical protein
MAYTEHNDWTGDPHTGDRRVHYRLYMTPDGKPTLICVQDFDYFDYDARLILSPEAWDREADAEDALVDLLPRINTVAGGLGLLDGDVRSRVLARLVRESIGRPESEVVW